MTAARPCKACGRELMFVKSQATGKYVPLDLETTVYELQHDPDTGEPVAVAREQAWVSHFATCTKADLFGSKGKAKGADRG